MPNDLTLWYALRSETNGLTSAHMSLMNIVRTTCEVITNFFRRLSYNLPE